MKKFISKLQQLPEYQKKIIFFTVMGVAALLAGFFFMQSAKQNVAKIGSSLNSVNLPKIELPTNPNSDNTNKAE